ncbi:dephospho-CoA triphosphoribosyl transferase family protein [Methyloversatilis sp. RAC08]|uniref:triphosphoribosyl-dephospho-CoA synthase n=1 Tax=Methyloversatilis sp. RAC08 TaxID=1842540 RepID=UPI0008551021|nr:triphosphoribosyl-dephospho-CoA synthase [Methyloversatilis sp. RAC08]AOF82703.1 dephospho-CoA triphosphoribosyl transferase family protein [Methyloversatilis sp. RAC08]
MLMTPPPDTGRIALQAALETAFLHACRLDVEALKPGNVGHHGDGHRMQVADFLASAKAAAGPICRADATVGERIEQAMRATWQAVGCNTNLGIVLGCAPIAHAALHRQPEESLCASLQRTLAGLTVTDASHAYAAIRLAQPAGLGRRDEDDVAGDARITLLQAMQLAAHRDSIASLYAARYELVLRHLLPVHLAARDRWCSEAWAAATVFMFCLALIPDTHIMRKHGPETALSVRNTAIRLLGGFERAVDPVMMQDTLMDWDERLKTAGINPGTSADLTVVTAFLAGALEITGA